MSMITIFSSVFQVKVMIRAVTVLHSQVNFCLEIIIIFIIITIFRKGSG